MNGRLISLLAALVVTGGATGIVIATYDAPLPADEIDQAVPPQLIWQLRTKINSLIETRKFPEAARLLQRLQRYLPGSPEVLRLLGRCEYENGNYDQARNIFYTLLVRKADDPVLRNNLGQTLIRQQAFEAGIKELLRARALAPGAAYIDYNLGSAYRLLGDTEKAERHLGAAARRGALSIAPPDVISDIPAVTRTTPDAVSPAVVEEKE